MAAEDLGVVLSEPGRVLLEPLRVDPPAAGEVCVRIEATGVCHSDLHAIEEDGWGYPLPLLLGHEGAGTVEALGAGVSGVAVGDRVVIGWKTACGSCAACERGAPRQCRRPPVAVERLHRADGTPLTAFLRTGTFATRTVVPAVGVVRIPRELPVEQACLIGCGVATGVMSAIETAGVWEGARVAVIGCGAVGLSVIQGARIAGATTIRAIDLDERKLEQARRFGATDVGEGPVDFAFDVVGLGSTFELARSLLVNGGTLTLVGIPNAGERAELDLPRLFDKRARILVSHGGDHLPEEDFPRLAQWALDGRLDLAGMVSRTAPLEAWSEAIDAMRAGDVVRTVLTP
ncbi:MAG TPA: alcohol dehydrogenase catalytic domain-containing protein [Gaiellaceae bacterium]|nr:alcohol dehydrogenase catalytic domain-containing protein [Gaiellaceae bacterium]